ncbi:MAG TPA: PDZ domain-containing protein [Pyrinomonadaceae bacterium]|nr:PDZ domain-containing protein [Pyrinomonadaceae bacterium]
MTLRNAVGLLFSLLFAATIVLAQQVAPAPPSAPGEPAMPMPPDAPQNFPFFIAGGSFLGVYAEDVSKDNMGRYNLREVRGVGITQVVKDSPAEKAGLRKDDVILRFDGENVTSVRKLNRLVSEVAPDQSVRLGISRSGSEQEVSVTIGKRNESMNAGEGFRALQGMQDLPGLRGLMAPEGPGGNVWKWEGPGQGGDMVFAFDNNRRIGVSTMQLTKQLAEYFGVAEGQGVLVTSVAEDSPAAKAGIKAGDVITAIDGEKVDGAGDVARGINKKKDGDVTLTVIRKGNQRTITVTPTEVKPMAAPGAVPQSARRIVIPRIELGAIPEMNISVPRIELPTIPQIEVQLPTKAPRVRIVKAPSQQPI